MIVHKDRFDGTLQHRDAKDVHRFDRRSFDAAEAHQFDEQDRVAGVHADHP